MPQSIPQQRVLAFIIALAATPTFASNYVGDVSPRIVGGTNATAEHEWMAGLHVYDPTDGPTGSYGVVPFCGASLIAPGWIITAAHCIKEGNVINNPAELLVRIDQPYLGPVGSSIPAEYQPQHEVTAVIPHSSYTTALSGKDIALLQLSAKTDIPPISIADGGIMMRLDSSEASNGAVDALGWGVFDVSADPENPVAGERPDDLQIATFDYLRLPFPGSSGSPTSVVAATNATGADTCFGDSGGPLFVPDGRILGNKTISGSRLVGITSYGSSLCSTNDSPGIYTKVADYTHWIETSTAANGDPLVDLQPRIFHPHHDNLPGSSSSDFSLAVFNNSRVNSVDSFTILLKSDNNFVLGTDIDSTLTCTGTHTRKECVSTAALPLGGSVSYDFSGTDTLNLPRTLSITAEIIAQSQDDYRNANDNDEYEINLTTGADASIALDQFNSLNGQFTITVTNHSDFLNATGAKATLSSNEPLDWTDTATCIALSEFIVECSLGDLAPLQTESRIIALPQPTSSTILYDLDVYLTQSSTDPNNTNNSDSRSDFAVQPAAVSASVASSSGGGGSAFWLVLISSLLGSRAIRAATLRK
jgi:secreted trypsin-like serine protease